MTDNHIRNAMSLLLQGGIPNGYGGMTQKQMYVTLQQEMTSRINNRTLNNLY